MVSSVLLFNSFSNHLDNCTHDTDQKKNIKIKSHCRIRLSFDLLFFYVMFGFWVNCICDRKKNLDSLSDQCNRILFVFFSFVFFSFPLEIVSLYMIVEKGKNKLSHSYTNQYFHFVLSKGFVIQEKKAKKKFRYCTVFFPKKKSVNE